MLSSNLLAITSALAAVVAAQSSSQGICPSAFQITSTAGALYSKQDGTQFPGNSGLGYAENEFQLTSDGTLITAAGVACTFTPWLVCRNQTNFSTRVTIASNSGALTLYSNGSPNAVASYNQTNSTEFYACTADGLDNQQIPASVTGAAPSATATSIPELYILPAYLTSERAKSNSGCRMVGLQASRCFPNNATYSIPSATPSGSGPVATYSANAADKAHHGKATAGIFGMATLFGALMA